MRNCSLTHEFSFHDSRLKRCVQSSDSIYLYFVTAKKHLKSDDKGAILLSDVCLVCEQIKLRDLNYWINEKESIEHPEPHNPISDIEGSSFDGETLELSGFGPDAGWVTWEIVAESFDLNWDHEELIH